VRAREHPANSVAKPLTSLLALSLLPSAALVADLLETVTE